MLQTIDQAIIATLVFFDLVDFPLKEEEIFNWLFVKEMSKEINFSFSQENIKQNLNQLLDQQIITKKNQFYFLPAREHLVLIREQRHMISLRKIIKARKLVKNWLRYMPWIKGVFLTNSLAYFNASENSDIDLLIVGQKNRLWLIRLLAVLPLKILNLRPTSNNKKDKFCLSYFVSDDNLNLEKYEAQNEFAILVYWAAFYWPILAKENLWSEFKKNNNWLKKYLPNFDWGNGEFVERVNNFKRIKTSKIGDWLEKIVKKFQLWYLPDDLKKNMNLNRGVIVGDKIIKLHNTSQRKEIYEKWQEKVKNILYGDCFCQACQIFS